MFVSSSNRWAYYNLVINPQGPSTTTTTWQCSVAVIRARSRRQPAAANIRIHRYFPPTKSRVNINSPWLALVLVSSNPFFAMFYRSHVHLIQGSRLVILLFKYRVCVRPMYHYLNQTITDDFIEKGMRQLKCDNHSLLTGTTNNTRTLTGTQERGHQVCSKHQCGSSKKRTVKVRSRERKAS